jgi:gliding motility-associated-like protein
MKSKKSLSMKQTRENILLIALLWGHILPILAQCPSDLLFIKAPESICSNSKELVLRTSKAKESTAQYIWRLPNGDSTITTDSVLIIKKPQPIHSGKYSVLTRIGTCFSTPVGALEVTILGLPTLTPEPVKQIKLCGTKDTTLTSKLKLSNGVKGEWLAAEGVEVMQPNAEKTAIKNLSVGENLLIWTLSTDKCLNFARDSFKLNVEIAPRMVSQGFVLDARDATLTVPLGTISGSNIDLINEIEIKIGKEPKSSGIITPDGKNLKYTRKIGFRGTDQFSIVVCNKRCLNLCSSPAIFQVAVDFNEQYPNITVPKLLSKSSSKGLVIENVDNYPENELLILDRWGGIVEKIPNYSTIGNAWDGTQSGKPLPSGAYYVVFYAKRDTNAPPKTDFKPVSSIIYIIE